MKQVCCCLLMALTTFGADPETEARHLKNVREMFMFYATVMDEELSNPQWFLDYAKTNSISIKKVNHIILEIAKETKAELESGGGSVWCSIRITEYMTWKPDPIFLPFLEEASLSTNRFVRRDALLGYIGVKKADSVEFVEARLPIGDDDDSIFDQREIYRQMGQQIRFCDEKGKKKIIGFMLRQTQTVNDSYLRDNLEQILLPNLPEYRHSIQREHFARRLQNSTNDLVRGRAEQIINEIKKVPVLQRKDLSDLLRKPADETKGE